MTWETSDIRNWLNTTFYNNAFDEEEKKNIQITYVVNNDLYRGEDVGKDTVDSIFLLNQEEMKKYGYYSNWVTDYALANGVYISPAGSGLGIFWLRSGYKDGMAECTYEAGSTIGFGIEKTEVTGTGAGVYPALWVSLNGIKKELGDTVQTKYKVGDRLMFGEYDQGDGIEPKDAWSETAIRAWLDQTFYEETFTYDEKEKILYTRVNNSNGSQLYCECGGWETYDKVFLLSTEEAEMYFSDDMERCAKGTKYAISRGLKVYDSYIDKEHETYAGNVNWWLRSRSGKNSAATIKYSGEIDYKGVVGSIETIAVRPVMWIQIEEEAAEESELPEKIKNDVKINDIINFGYYEQDNNRENGQEEIEWQVIAVEGNKALLLSKYSLENGDIFPDDFDGDDNWEFYEYLSWDGCDIRRWLNEEFYYMAFDWQEREKIVETYLASDVLSPHGDYEIYTYDKVFLWSIDEIELYFPRRESRYTSGTEYMAATCDNYAFLNYEEHNYLECWGIRSFVPHETAPGNAGMIYVNEEGETNDGTGRYDGWYYGWWLPIRPALWISLE